MTTINNLNIILNLLEFNSDDDFYFCQILKRRKDNPDMKKHCVVINSYYIRSKEYLEREFDTIKTLCYNNNARCVINLNKRSFKTIAFRMNMKLPEILMNGNYKEVIGLFDSCCGQYSNEKNNKKWIIDIDDKNPESIMYIKERIKNTLPNVGEYKDIATIPTKNGFHLITKGFDKRSFDTIPWTVTDKPEIKDDKPTILFIP